MAEVGGVRDPAQTAAYLSRNLVHWRELGFGVWMLRSRDDGEFVGRALLRGLVLEGLDEVEVGYAFTPRVWGQGLATEIGEALVALAKSELRLDSLVGVTTLANHSSQRVLEKLGLRREREVIYKDTPCHVYRIRFSERSRELPKAAPR
jgi:RimJ/RimL family protein N-acetyltransferase